MWGTGLRLFADLPTIPNCKEKYKTLWLQQTSEHYPAQWQLQRVHLCRRHEINSLDVPRLYCMTEHFAETSQMPDMKEHNHFWLSIWPLIIFPLAHYFCVLFTCTLQPCTELPWVKWVQVLEVAQYGCEGFALGVWSQEMVLEKETALDFPLQKTVRV